MSTLHILPCLDSDEMAASRWQKLDIPRHLAAALGRSAVEAARTGQYITNEGTTVDWSTDVAAACSAKVSIPPDAALPTREGDPFSRTHIQVTNETTLGASRRLVESGHEPLALNFANGVNPGGGFLVGARAQEEGLCRSSALYLTLLDDPMYEAHGQRPRPDSTDWAIYSPSVPVFRENGQELEKPWLLNFITCAAPYAPSIGQPEAGDLLERRIRRVLAIARAYHHPVLVLGAWGCGAFGNDPHRTAKDFRQALENEFDGAFSDIVFAITDWSPERKTLGPFRDAFSPGASRSDSGTDSNDSRQTDDPYNLGRFLLAQKCDYEQALSELKSGEKHTHWMWYIFPQLDGLAFSAMSKRYSIKSVEEAKAYLGHSVLGKRLLECAEAVVGVEGRSATDIFGSPDDLKLRSCATLFASVSPQGSVFDSLLGKYYEGGRDSKTLKLLGIDPKG